jgi:hypothetical protein
MVRHRLDSLSDFARQGYNLRITCNVCGHSVEASPVALLDLAFHRRLPRSIEQLEGRLKCSRCSWRGATITPTDPQT